MVVRPRSSEPVALDTRERIAHYELLTEISRAPRASWWAAHSSGGADAGRFVTLRRVQRSSIDATRIERLRICGEVAKRIRDPKVVAVLDVVVAAAEVAIVSEYIDGEPLRSVQRLAAQRGAALPIAVSMRIALDLLMGARGAAEAFRNASKYAAGRKVAPPSPHGAISGETAIVASFGETMLTDFAVAGIGNCLPDHPAAMRYWAPERFDASATLDERADVFSVGVLLWELVANQPLFGPPRWSHDAFNLEDADTASVIEKVRTAPIARLDATRRAGAPVSSKVADVVARALERDRAARFASADEMIAAIFRLEGAVATPDEVVTALDRVARPILEARRASLGQLSDKLTTRDSAPPESAKGTYRPPAPAASMAPIAPTIPKSPRVPLSMLVMGTASAQKPLRSASGRAGDPTAVADAKASSSTAVATVRPSAPARPSASGTMAKVSVPVGAPHTPRPTASASPRAALPKASPPQPPDPARVPYRAVPPPRASAAPAAPLPKAPAISNRPPKPPLPVRASQRAAAIDEDETNRIAPRWQVAPDPGPDAPAAKMPSARPQVPPSSTPAPAARVETTPPRATSAAPAEPPQLEHDGKGPFGWAPDDSTSLLDPAAGDLSPRFITVGGLKASVRAVVAGAVAAAALLALVIALSATGRTPVPAEERLAASPPTSRPTEPAAPPSSAEVGAPTAEATQPPPSGAAAPPPHDQQQPAPPPADPTPSTTAAPRQPRPGGERPKPAGNDPEYRPRGI